MSGAERMIGKSATKAGAWKTPRGHKQKTEEK